MTKIDRIFKLAFKMRNRLQGSNVTNKVINKDLSELYSLLLEVNSEYKHVNTEDYFMQTLNIPLERFDRREGLELVIQKLITRNKPLWSKI